MRKFMTVFFALVLVLGGFSMTAYAADCTRDTSVDRAGDWVATLGKKGLEKEQVLAKRKADRVIACSQREAERISKEMQKAGNDMKKKLGF